MIEGAGLTKRFEPKHRARQGDEKRWMVWERRLQHASQVFSVELGHFEVHDCGVRGAVPMRASPLLGLRKPR